MATTPRSPEHPVPTTGSLDELVASVLDVGDLDGLDGATALAEATASVRLRRATELRELLIVAHWAGRHGHPADERDPMLEPGGEGTPAVREYCLPELAMARDTHFLTVRTATADVLDLTHRLPLTWAKVVALGCEAWVARKVAVLSRDVPLAAVGVVDRAVAQAIGGQAPSTVLEIARAKVIEADPETHAMRRELERRRRYVTLSKSDEFGYRHVIARVTAGDAAWIDAMVDRVADILSAEHGHDHNRDQLRSLAMGWLARPADLLRLLMTHTETDQQPEDGSDGDQPVGDDPDASRPVWTPAHLDDTVGRLASMSCRQLASLRGTGTVFVHLTDQSLRRQAGVARVEGNGPFLVQALAELLGHADVTVKPVLDLAGRVRTDAYEHPDRLKDHVWATTGGDVFPFSPRTATREGVDFDHVLPYRSNGPPGQTGSHNSGPLRRRHHRWKTFGGYRYRPAGHGRNLWQTPHGLCLLVDHTGTRPLDPDQAEVMLSAPPGLDIHFADVEWVGAA